MIILGLQLLDVQWSIVSGYIEFLDCAAKRFVRVEYSLDQHEIPCGTYVRVKAFKNDEWGSPKKVLDDEIVSWLPEHWTYASFLSFWMGAGVARGMTVAGSWVSGWCKQ